MYVENMYVTELTARGGGNGQSDNRSPTPMANDQLIHELGLQLGVTNLPFTGITFAAIVPHSQSGAVPMSSLSGVE